MTTQVMATFTMQSRPHSHSHTRSHGGGRGYYERSTCSNRADSNQSRYGDTGSEDQYLVQSMFRCVGSRSHLRIPVHSHLRHFIFSFSSQLRLDALIPVVFAHLKLIMKCMRWAKQAINQSRCVSRWVPAKVSGAQRPDGSNSTLALEGKSSPRLTRPMAVIANICASLSYYN